MNWMPKKYKTTNFDSDASFQTAADALRNKKCLHDIYVEMYHEMMQLKRKYLKVNSRKVLELGSGGGFIKDIYPKIITSDVTKVNHVDLVVDAQQLPFQDNELDAIFAVHVIHHIPDITKFLKEAIRTTAPGGGIVLVEPYWSPVAKFLYKHVHPEPFDENAKSWTLEQGGPMSGSNQALSYILLKRDRKEFQEKFPELELVYDRPFGCVRYMATGGLWLKPKLPSFLFTVLKYVEMLCQPLMGLIGIHHIFVLRNNKTNS